MLGARCQVPGPDTSATGAAATGAAATGTGTGAGTSATLHALPKKPAYVILDPGNVRARPLVVPAPAPAPAPRERAAPRGTSTSTSTSRRLTNFLGMCFDHGLTSTRLW